MENTFWDYFEKHRILTSSAEGFVAVDAIVEDPFEFIEVVKLSDYFISEIIIWDRVRIGVGSVIGYGGPPDPRAAGEYYFSESLLSCEFDDQAETSQYYEFIHCCIDKYPDCDLYPGFTICGKATPTIAKGLGK